MTLIDFLKTWAGPDGVTVNPQNPISMTAAKKELKRNID